MSPTATPSPPSKLAIPELVATPVVLQHWMLPVLQAVEATAAEGMGLGVATARTAREAATKSLENIFT